MSVPISPIYLHACLFVHICTEAQSWALFQVGSGDSLQTSSLALLVDFSEVTHATKKRSSGPVRLTGYAYLVVYKVCVTRTCANKNERLCWKKLQRIMQ